MIKKSDDIKFDFVSYKKIENNATNYNNLVSSVKEKYDFCLREKNLRTYVKIAQYYALVLVIKTEEVVNKNEELSMYLRYVEPGADND